MKVIIISNYALIREGIYSIMSRCNRVDIMLVAETLKESMYLIKSTKIDIVLFDLHEQNKDGLLLIKELKECGVKSKFIILDFNKNKNIFVEAIRCGVEGYILGKSDEIELMYIIEQVYKGKKYFDSYFIDCMVRENSIEPEKIEQLTAREKEILCEIGKGMSNQQISKKLCISENTVKKHNNHIFDKLNMKDRTQLALYANKCGMLNRDANIS
ncbi:LuxR family transcriptional regulator [Clostridium carboxidivorans P7]|uniref:Stage 0 sporulation protein A homolog n=1 Tax=Clostridium carboxidivorans P7 TaxID=536227 RepID=C6PXX2_9CLOT|nr:LuxR C-terminal-related transcriptional regulator [Clostridium carboxidivorans]AKN31964.1 LuxR family transcriptional regulator [Clostridium carboxidivorans P7]EET85910.1 two component transcriptional regulator, LuxR family [Clostridium carboxidivorans P7]EFG87900.1 transcriptional regulator, LuxR family [Clostridium carboxidivorans P7]